MNMTESEAKKEIEHNVFCNTDDFEMKISKECYKTIINALEKQIAKKPKKIEVEGYRYTDTYRCPTCEGNFSGTGIAYYCYHCGQKLDWSEYDD